MRAVGANVNILPSIFTTIIEKLTTKLTVIFVLKKVRAVGANVNLRCNQFGDFGDFFVEELLGGSLAEQAEVRFGV